MEGMEDEEGEEDDGKVRFRDGSDDGSGDEGMDLTRKRGRWRNPGEEDEEDEEDEKVRIR